MFTQTLHLHRRICLKTPSYLAALCLFSSISFASTDYALDATALPLEELLKTKYIPASHIANQISNASSAVSIVTAQDIKDYGYQTLGEILASMKGLFVSQLYNYTMLGGRGFPNTNYAGRFIVLIDGYRADDSMFGQAYLGNDGILDVSLIDRVEYIPGGGSAGYGEGALLGAINIITKKGSDIDGVQVALGMGSGYGGRQRVNAGTKLDNGLDILLSASFFNVQGTLQTDNDNDERNKRFFAKLSSDSFSLTTAYARRDLNNPTGTYSSTDSTVYGDENLLSVFKHHTDLASSLKLSTSVWFGQYRYLSTSNLPSVDYVSDAQNVARWYGGDVRLIGTWFDEHKISFGANYRNDFDWNWSSVWGMPSSNIYLPDHGHYQPRKTYGLYAYDDYTITPKLSLNYGVRYEKSDNDVSSMLSPHAALIYKPWEETVLKLSAGMSNRQATPSEGENIWLKPEQTKTLELVVEQQLGWQTKLTGSLYRYRMSHRIDNYSKEDIDAQGAELELEKHWGDGTRLRTSYTWQEAKESDGTQLGHSPSTMAKFNLVTPLLNDALRLGVEAQHINKFLLYSFGGDYYRNAYTLVNVNLLAHHIAPNLDINFKVSDLLNQSDPEKDTWLPQSGRTFWLEMEYTFK